MTVGGVGGGREVAVGGASRRHSTLVATGILLSRLSGLLREKLLAYFLGTGIAVDAFRAALKIPNMLQNLLGEGVLSASFIPVYARFVDEGREEDAGRLAGAVAALLALVAGCLVVVGVVFARPLTALFVWGFVGERYELTVTLVRILTPGVGLLVLSAWCLGVLNSHRRFFLAYVAPVLWNAAMITALVAAAAAGVGQLGLAKALAWGALVGGGLQFLVQLPLVLRLSRGLRIRPDRDAPGVRRVVRAFVPIVGGRGVVQVAAWVDLLLASFLAAGAVAALGYAQTLFMLPIALFGMSVAAAELPDLSSMDHGDGSMLRGRLDDGMARIAFYVLPTAMVYVVFGDEVVRLLFGGGEFGFAASVQVAVILAVYAFALLPTTASRLLQSTLYGAGDARTPAKIAALRVLLSTTLGGLLMLQLDQVAYVGPGFEVVGSIPTLDTVPRALRVQADNAARLGAAGLALGAVAGSWLEYVLLRRSVRRRAGPVQLGGGVLGRTVMAAGVAALVAVPTGLRPLGIVDSLALLATSGVVYLAAATALRVPESRELVARVRELMSTRGT